MIFRHFKKLLLLIFALVMISQITTTPSVSAKEFNTMLQQSNCGNATIWFNPSGELF